MQIQLNLIIFPCYSKTSSQYSYYFIMARCNKNLNYFIQFVFIFKTVLYSCLVNVTKSSVEVNQTAPSQFYLESQASTDNLELEENINAPRPEESRLTQQEKSKRMKEQLDVCLRTNSCKILCGENIDV